MSFLSGLEGNERRYREIIERLKKEEETFLDEIKENLDSFLSILLKDILNPNVLQYSFICLGNLYYRENIEINEQFNEDLLHVCSKIVLEKNDFKPSCYIMWFLSEQKKVKSFDIVFKLILHTLKSTDIKLVNESLQCLHQYLKNYPKETIQYASKWIIPTLQYLFTEKTSGVCQNILIDADLEKFFVQIPQEVSNIMKDKFKTIFTQIKEKLKMNIQEEVNKGLMAWGISIILMGKHFIHVEEFSAVIQSLEVPFSHKNMKIRTEAFHNWKYLIMNIVFYTDRIEKSNNRLNLIMRPLLGYLKSDINEEIRSLCYQNWMYLLKCLSNHLNSQMVFQNVIEPIMNCISQEDDVNLFKMAFKFVTELLKDIKMSQYLKNMLNFMKSSLYQSNTSELISFYRKLCKACENQKDLILSICQFTGNLFHECPIEEFSNLNWSNFIYDLLEIIVQFKYCNFEEMMVKWITLPKIYFEKTEDLFEKGIGLLIKNVSNFNDVLNETKDHNHWKILAKSILTLEITYKKVEPILIYPVNKGVFDQEMKGMWKELFVALEDPIPEISLKLNQIVNEKNMNIVNEIFHILCECISSFPDAKLSNFTKLVEKLEYKKKEVQNSIMIFINGIKTPKRALGIFAGLNNVLTVSNTLWKASFELLERCCKIDKAFITDIEHILLNTIQNEKLKHSTIEFCQKFSDSCSEKIRSKWPKRKKDSIDNEIELEVPSKKIKQMDNQEPIYIESNSQETKRIKEEKVKTSQREKEEKKEKEPAKKQEKEKNETKNLVPSINTNKLFEDMNQDDLSLKDSKLYPELMNCKEKCTHSKFPNIKTLGELCSMNIDDIPPSMNVYELRSWITTNYSFILHRNQLEKQKGNIKYLSREELIYSQEVLLKILLEINSNLK